MIYVVDMEGKFLNVNRAGIEMMGCASFEEVVGESFHHFFFFEDDAAAAYRDIIGQCGAVRDIETRMRRKDGDIRDVQITAAMRTTLTGKAKGYEGFVIDITPRKTAEGKLAASEARYRTVLENSLSAIYMFQDGGYFSYVNPRMVKVLGYEKPEEILGRPFWEFIGAEDRAVVKERGLRREQGELFPRRYKFRMLKKNGENIWVDMRASHVPAMGRPAVVGNFIDITREKQAESEIRQLSRRLIRVIEEERRALAADLHDEFGQVLTSLQLDVEELLDAYAPDRQEPRDICRNVVGQIQKLAEKIRDTTSRLRPEMLDHLGLIPTLQWFIGNYRRRRPELDIAFQCAGFKRRLGPDVELALYRVCQEAMRNIEKYAQAKRVTIQLTHSHPQVIFIVKDDGVGFDAGAIGLPDDAGRIGIGLLSMKERMASLGGTIAIRSAPGRGATIRVEAPVNRQASP